jgi:hypothetical protein
MNTKAQMINSSTEAPITQNPCYMPLILDACCGSRMFWFDKGNPNCLFIDKRSETVEAKL